MTSMQCLVQCDKPCNECHTGSSGKRGTSDIDPKEAEEKKKSQDNDPGGFNKSMTWEKKGNQRES